MSRRKFTGKLSKKREPRKAGLLIPENELREIWNTWAKEDWEKILLLCEEFDVRKDDHMAWNLVLALAREYVPGFQETKSRGPQRKWTELRKALLVVEIDRLADAESCSIDRAADMLVKLEPWNSFVAKKEKGQLAETTPDPGEALRRVYYDSRGSKWAITAKKAFLYHCEQGTMSTWEEELLSAFSD